jgi:tetratricopeptide (TPR) repeat protein
MRAPYKKQPSNNAEQRQALKFCQGSLSTCPPRLFSVIWTEVPMWHRQNLLSALQFPARCLVRKDFFPVLATALLSFSLSCGIAAAQTTTMDMCIFGHPAEKALSACKSILETETNDYRRVVAITGLARARYMLKQYDAALADINEAIKRYPNAERYEQRGLICTEMNAAAKNGSDPCMADLSASLKLNAQNPELLMVRGSEYLRKKEYDLAIRDFDAVLQLDPKWWTALFGRGLAKNLKNGDGSGNADIAALKEYRRDDAESYFASKGFTFDKVGDAKGPAFCRQVARIASEAADGFRKLRTSKDEAFEAVARMDPNLHVRQWLTSESLPGAKCATSVSDDPVLFQRLHPQYTCSWKLLGTVDKAWLSQQASSLTSALVSCLSIASPAADEKGYFKVSAGNAVFSVEPDLLRSYSRITFRVEKKLTAQQETSCLKASVKNGSAKDRKICLDSYQPQ